MTITYPQTIAAALVYLEARLTTEQRTYLQQCTEDRLAFQHIHWGAAVREDLGLWGANPTLLFAGGGTNAHPDSVSMLLLRMLRRKVRAEAPNASRCVGEST